MHSSDQYEKFVRYIIMSQEQFQKIGQSEKPRDRSYEEHRETMQWSENTQTKESFFKENYYSGAEHQHLWDKLNKRTFELCQSYAPKDGKILSIGTGGCGVELKLSDAGYDVTCSDLELTEFHKKLQKLFPNSHFKAIDFLSDQDFGRYQFVMIVEVMLVLSAGEIDKMLANAFRTLEKGGKLLFTIDVSPFSKRNNFVFRYVYPLDAFIHNLIQKMKGSSSRLVPHHYGWRFTTAFIKSLVEKNQFQLLHYEEIAYESDLLNRLYVPQVLTKIFGRKVTYAIFSTLGRVLHTPYRRYFVVQKRN